MDEITQNQRRLALEQAVALLTPLASRQTVVPSQVVEYATAFEAFLIRPQDDKS